MEPLELWQIVLIMVGSILVPLIGYMFALRGFIRDTATAAIGDVAVDIASLKSEFKAYRESQKEWIDLYLKMSKPGNPHPNKEVLLEKLKNDTITREEAIALQEIMAEERGKAESENDFLKLVIIIGVLALVATAISKASN